MDQHSRTKISKFLSYVLRHDPDSIGITLDSSGWVAVETLLAQCAAHDRAVARAELDEVVRTSEKQRFAFSADGERIRASQGHSIEVDLAYMPTDPPAALVHGTVESALDAVRERGLAKMSRHHVHLSADEATAMAVGGRRGKAVLLRVDARGMHEAGHAFFLSANGVWLTDHVPPHFITFPDP